MYLMPSQSSLSSQRGVVGQYEMDQAMPRVSLLRVRVVGRRRMRAYACRNHRAP